MKVMPRGAYYGRNLRSREVAGLILTEKVHPTGERTPPHAHAQPYLCLVLEGTWEEQSPKGARLLGPQTLIFHPPGDVHSDDFRKNDGRVFAIEMDSSWAGRTMALGSTLDEPRVISAGPLSGLAMRLLDESRRIDSASELVIEGLMLELLGTLGRSRLGTTLMPAPAWMRTVEEMLQTSFREPISIRTIATRAGVHPVHLARAFRSRHGCTISAFVSRLRVEAACVALIGSGKPLSEIALNVGFFDQSHFTRAFHRLVGTTPARFRASVRSTDDRRVLAHARATTTPRRSGR
jgi:AraC family transcriptional regulator